MTDTLNTNLNTSPYYDDGTDAINKHYHRLLFKPRLAVQARELTQLQSILQNQIDRFGSNIFKEGSLVSGGQFTFDNKWRYIKIADNDPLANSVNVNNFVNTEITGNTSGVKGIVYKVQTGAQATSVTKTLFVKYTKTATDTVTEEVTGGETITANNGVQAIVLNQSGAETGSPYIFSIAAGVVFAKDHFISFPDSSIVVDAYSDTPNAVVGFEIIEDIVDFTEDATLLDPAQGSPNYTAPGADRLKITAQLVSYPTAASASTSFVQLFTVLGGVLQSKFETPQYNIIRDEMARRTEDESGDYYVTGMNVQLREHLDNTVNYGYLKLANGGNSSLLAVGVDPGKAYVKGYDIETIVTKYTTTRKGVDYTGVEQQTITANYGNYIIVKEFVGGFNLNTGVLVRLYDTAQQRLTAKGWSTAAQTGTQLGTATVKAVELLSGTAGTPAATFRVYLYDIKMTSGSFGAIRSIYYDDPTNADGGGDIVLDGGAAVLYESSFNSGVYPTANKFIRKLRDENDLVDTTFSFFRSEPVTVATNGTFSVTTPAANEIFPYSVGLLNSTQKAEFFVTLNASATVTLPGTVSITTGTAAVTGVGTTFTNLNVGDKISIATVSGTFFIASITSNTIMTLTGNVGSTASAQAMTKVYQPGDVIDFRNKGAAAGTTRTINISSSTTASFDMGETLSGSIAGVISYRLQRTDAREIRKDLRRTRYVQVSGASSLSGPWPLGFSDVYRVVSVRQKTGSFTAPGEGTDVTTSFTLDNGQRDTHYDNARLIANAGVTIGVSDVLLVQLDYFAPDYSQGVGYFSVDSYPIDDVNVSNTAAIRTEQIPIFTSPVTGVVYDLRNSVDTRPVRTNTATDATTVGTASTNPTAGTTFQSGSSGLHTPVFNLNFILDYSYYLPRRDIIVIDSKGEFRVIQGTPDANPITPATPADAMSLADLYISPYPSLSPNYATLLKRTDIGCTIDKTAHKRYTMKDIGTLDQRIGNLEYYQSLSLLETKTKDMKITDTNGLDRFKNGFFVEPFTSHDLGDLGNPDFRIAVEPEVGMARPVFTSEVIDFRYSTGSGVVNTSNVVSLPYTEVAVASQPYATSTRNAAGFYYNFKGTLTLAPNTDYWVDTDRIPDLQVTAGPDASIWQNLSVPAGTRWNNWQTTWTGRSGNTTNTTQTRTGTTTTVSSQTVSQSLGDRVIDVSVIQTIRTRLVRFSANGMKANTKLHPYFDGEDVAAYCTPTTSAFVATGVQGAAIVSDADGWVYGTFRIPNDGTKRFRVGDRVFRLTDSITNGDDAITSAEDTYSAQGLVQQKQETFLTTTQPKTTTTTVSETRRTTTVISPPRISGFEDDQRSRATGGDPIGQSFNVSGIGSTTAFFASSIDLYFATKDATKGAMIQLREMDSAGYITSTVIPYSDVYVPNASINTSSNGTVATNIKFRAPICLLAGAEYAFIVIPEGNNPNTVVWTSKLGESDIATGFRVTEQPYSGNFFASSNSTTWSPIQDEDFKFTLYRAKFTVGSGTATIANRPREFFGLTTVSGSWDTRGETVNGETRLTTANVVGAISVGHSIVGTTSGASGTVTNINGSIYRVSGVSSVNFSAAENATVNYANGVATGSTLAITAVTRPTGSLYKYKVVDVNNTDLVLNSSNGSFSVGEELRGATSNHTAIILDYNTMPYSLIDFESSMLNFAETSTVWTAKATSNAAVIDSSFSNINVGDNSDFGTEKTIYGGTAETANLGGQKSLTAQALLTTTSEFVSPIIDLNRTFAISVWNLINNDSTGETGISGGNAINKYISQKVTLDNGQDAEDLQVYLTAYRPPSSDLQVFAKLINAQDGDTFSAKNWIQMTASTGSSAYSSISDKNDFKEFKYKLPTASMTGSSGEYQYVKSGVTFTGFKYFQIKIVFLGSNSALVPTVSDARALALQI
jgi:hypothetical protein